MGMMKDLYIDDMEQVESIMLDVFAKSWAIEEILKDLYGIIDRDIELIINDYNVDYELYDTVYIDFEPSLPIENTTEYADYVRELITELKANKDFLDKALSVLDERFDIVA